MALPPKMERELQGAVRRHPSNGSGPAKGAVTDEKEEAGWHPKTGKEWHDEGMTMPTNTPMQRSMRDAALKFAGETLLEESKTDGSREGAEDIVHRLTHIRANMMGSRTIGMFNAAKQ